MNVKSAAWRLLFGIFFVGASWLGRGSRPRLTVQVKEDGDSRWLEVSSPDVEGTVVADVIRAPFDNAFLAFPPNRMKVWKTFGTKYPYDEVVAALQWYSNRMWKDHWCEIIVVSIPETT